MIRAKIYKFASLIISGVFAAAAFNGHALADEILAAVASNTTNAARTLKADFESTTGHKITISTGSTGLLYAQIVNGAPFDIFLSADSKHPRLLETAGRAIPDTRFTYATGELILWSPDLELESLDGPAILSKGSFRKIAVANPRLAPYGAAAMEVIENLGLTQRIQDKIVMGENAAQAFAHVKTGNAQIGLIPRSFIIDLPADAGGGSWAPPQSLYTPLTQDAILLLPGANNPAAKEFLVYLKTGRARKILQSNGFILDECQQC